MKRSCAAANGVGRVLQHRADRRLGPVAADVALRIDVRGGRWAAGAVQVICDPLACPAFVDREVEDLLDDLGLLAGRLGRQRQNLPVPGDRDARERAPLVIVKQLESLLVGHVDQPRRLRL